MKDKIIGGKKTGQEPSAVIDPETGELLVSGKQIRKATLKYCVNNLKNNSVSEKVKVIVELKENLHKLRMNMNTMEEFTIEIEEFEDVVKKFSSKDTKSYDFLLKAGDGYKAAIGQFCAMMINQESFPEEFRKTILHMLWKQKGPSEVIKNSRFLHLKETYLPRTV